MRVTLIPYSPAEHEGYCTRSYVESIHAQEYAESPWKLSKAPLHARAARILAPECSVWVAVDSKDHDWFCGWASAVRVGDDFVLRYVYVSYMRRRRGIGDQLLVKALGAQGWDGQRFQSEHWTRVGRKLVFKYQATWNPWGAS